MAYRYEVTYIRPDKSEGCVIGHAETEEKAAADFADYRKYYAEMGYTVPAMTIEELCATCDGRGYRLGKRGKHGIFRREIPCADCTEGSVSTRTLLVVAEFTEV